MKGIHRETSNSFVLQKLKLMSRAHNDHNRFYKGGNNRQIAVNSK